MNGLKEKRLEDYKVTQLFPINILQENKKKNLSISLNLFKICRHVPKEEMGHMKKIQKEVEKNKVSILLYKKDFNLLNEDETVEVKKLLNKRSATPSRNSPYIKFLVKSFLLTLIEDIKFSSFEEELNESWCFELSGQKYDITTNVSKKSENCIYFDSEKILDSYGLIKEDCLKYIHNILPISVEFLLLKEMTEALNKLRSQFLMVYQVQEAVEMNSEALTETTQQHSSKVS